MKLTVLNLSSQISDQDLAEAVSAIDYQVQNHFSKEWGINAEIDYFGSQNLSILKTISQNTESIIYIGDSYDDPTVGVGEVLGYHTTNLNKISFGFVYLDICKLYGEAWTVVLSHEVLELLADPTAVLLVTGPDPKDSAKSVNYRLEVCDPTQNDNYVIQGIKVCNFVTHKYFGMQGGGYEETNYKKLPLAPFHVMPKGYIEYESQGSSGTIFGAKISKKIKLAKLKMQQGRRNARRNSRLEKVKKIDLE